MNNTLAQSENDASVNAATQPTPIDNPDSQTTATEQNASEEVAEEPPLTKAISSLTLRGIGPAVMGGRIADIAVHPTKRSTWYVAVGSGGVWKTTNAGTTWHPIFDEQPSYSIGCVTLDPTNPEIVWVGTGENVSGRHVGWGDGVYRSRDGGQTWQQMGLECSEHIGKILISPEDGNVVYVAAEGPLWSDGGERGVYKTSDGGESWMLSLEIDEHTGVTDIALDPSNPNVIYAAAYQRRRHVWSFMGGGPGSGIHKSSDGGETWRRMETGLPKGDMGKIGLAITPADPAIVYATIEAKEDEKGFYASHNRGESWERRSAYISGGTGPHYYQVIQASPQDVNLIYQMDVFIQVTRDGGQTFNRLETGKSKHSDNHAIWIDPQDGDHLLVGSDAGLYETFDQGQSWRHFPNLPIAQFYRLDLDSSEPFYNILGGAQDLGTLFGPSRTPNVEGVRNQDWYVPLGADGYHVAFDPADPDTFYVEYQVGNLFRYDRRSEEMIDIQPQVAPDDPPERWNWDAPILVSPHNSKRLYFASQRLWRSEDRGDSWMSISDDLTRNHNRYELEMMGKVWSIDDLYDTGAMSQYCTISNLAESPLVEGLLYVATDDGLIQVTENGGLDWRKATPLPDVPELAFIQGVTASQHQADGVFAVAGAHKLGDFRPYLYESQDRGRTWQSIAGDLPDDTILWAIEQDHINPDLLFLAAEFGLYFSPNRGINWHKLTGGVPTIAFRDLKIHRRDNDLVGASFGRGFYVLDDYSPLRQIGEEMLEEEAYLFPVRDAWWYVPYLPMQGRGQPTLGSTYFTAPNPPFGALITYHLKSALLSDKESRHIEEKALRETDEKIPFPGWETLNEESLNLKPKLLILIRDAQDQPVRWIEGPTEEGLHRINWNLRLSPPDPINLEKPAFSAPWEAPPLGPLVAPGQYSAEIGILTKGKLRFVGGKQTFDVKPVSTVVPETDLDAVTTFQQRASNLLRRVDGAVREIDRVQTKLEHLRAALVETPQADVMFFARLDEMARNLTAIQTRLVRNHARGQLNEAAAPSIRIRVGRIVRGHWGTRQMPTVTQQQSLDIAETDFTILIQELATLIDSDLAQLESEMGEAGAPWTPGRRLS